VVTQSQSNGGKRCLAVVRTPLQLINASEYIFEHGIEGATLVVIRNSRKWGFSVFQAVPSMALWGEVIEFHWADNIFNKNGSYPALRILGDLYDDARFRRFFGKARRDWSDLDVLIIGNTNDLWLRHLANSLNDRRALVECEDGAATLNSNWAPTKSWSLRKVLLGFDAKDPCLDEVYTSYDGISLAGVEVKKNRYGYIRSLFDQGELKVSEDVWFVGQPLTELALMSRDAYLASVRAVKNNYAGKGCFIYCPHPSESESNVRFLCSSLGVERLNAKSIIEVSILASDNVPARVASFYSSAISTVIGIFSGKVCVDVYRPDKELFEDKMRADTYDEVYGAFRKIIDGENNLYGISKDSYSILLSN